MFMYTHEKDPTGKSIGGAATMRIYNVLDIMSMDGQF